MRTVAPSCSTSPPATRPSSTTSRRTGASVHRGRPVSTTSFTRCEASDSPLTTRSWRRRRATCVRSHARRDGERAHRPVVVDELADLVRLHDEADPARLALADQALPRAETVLVEDHRLDRAAGSL